MLPLYKEKLNPIDLKHKAEQLYERLRSCTICPNECNVHRELGEVGDCGTADDIYISGYGAHYGEEPPLVGTNGSGTIFFAGCSLKCEFCQNYDISQLKRGEKISVPELSSLMLDLQNKGCHNINLVTPTHYAPQIVEAVSDASEKGLELPIVYNSSGYDSIETLRLLENVIDIYMPDMKYSNEANALKYSDIQNYWEVVTSAVKEMHRQVGDLKISRRGIAQRGILIRHLVLPNNQAGSDEILRFIAEEVSQETYINIMDQYYPAYKAAKYPEINRRITNEEFHQVLNKAQKLGLYRGFEEIYS